MDGRVLGGEMMDREGCNQSLSLTSGDAFFAKKIKRKREEMIGGEKVGHMAAAAE